MTLCKDLKPSVNIDGLKHAGTYTNIYGPTDRRYEYCLGTHANPNKDVSYFLVEQTGGGNANFAGYFITISAGGYRGRIMYDGGLYKVVVPDPNVSPDGLSALNAEYRANQDAYDSMAIQFWKKAQP